VRSYWPLILILAAMWGASYLFIKVAVDDIPPAAMTELRVLLAGLLLLGYLVVRTGMTRAVGELRAAWVPCAVLGVINAALPMGLVAWGETHIDSSIAGREALAGLAGLVLIPTFAGQLVLFRVLRLHGSRKLSIVTYLMPVFAVVYGAILLDEPVTAAMVGAFSLIVVGAVLASGQRLFGYRAQETAA